jgi:TRAP-type mannitol/chloroaromatic compound transport system permease small subunit
MRMIDGLLWVIGNIGRALVNIAWAVANPSQWLNLGDMRQVARLIYYGGSVEFFFAVFTLFLILTAAGLVWRPLMWAVVRGLEGFANGLGRLVAWVGLLMVLQQILIVFLQRIFRVSAIEIGPFGYTFARDLSWWSEELKLYNAMVVCLCISYTFVQGGHVRVDLFYARVRFRTRKIIDMAGALLFMMPMAVMTWLYAWFFMWRSLVNPKVSASETLAAIERKGALMRWQVETIGFSPNGFDAYFLFKVLMVAFAGLVFLHAIAVFYRALLEFREGPASENKYLDRDPVGDAASLAH